MLDTSEWDDRDAELYERLAHRSPTNSYQISADEVNASLVGWATASGAVESSSSSNTDTETSTQQDDTTDDSGSELPPLDITWADGFIERSIAIQAYWDEILGRDGLPSPSIIADALRKSDQSPNVGLTAVSRWIEPLRDRWRHTAIDPNNHTPTTDSIDLDSVGVGILTKVSRLSEATKDDRIELLRRAEAGIETNASIRELRDSSTTAREYLESKECLR